MSWTQTDIDAIDEAMKKIVTRGVVQVSYSDGTVEYFSNIKALERARALAVREVSREAAKAAGHKSLYSLARFT